MPELPEVETIRRALNHLISGVTIEDVSVYWNKIIDDGDKTGVEDFRQKMIGQTLHTVNRRGKYLLFEWDDYAWISHLRMEGKYLVVNHEEPYDSHTHVICKLSDGRDLRYRDVRKFGRIQILPLAELPNAVSRLGLGPEPQLLSSAYLVSEFQKTKRLIKAVLLDQKIIAGVGNIYADEIIFRAQVHPMQPANSLTLAETELICESVQAVLSAATEQGGTTIRTYANSFGEAGHFQVHLNVYGQTGKPCPRCGHPIVKMKVAQRGTHYCPHCQQLHG